MLKKIIRLFIGRKIYQGFLERIYTYCLYFMNHLSVTDPNSNGEINAVKYAFSRLGINNNFILFDVGANIGLYSKCIYNSLNNYSIVLYTFEPFRSSFDRLLINLAPYKNICKYNFGFGEVDETRSLYFDVPMSRIASLYRREDINGNQMLTNMEEVKIKTIDNFCLSEGIEEIDYLKIDVEGNELSVLKGAHNLIQKNKIKYIQFEFGGCNIDSRTYFRDFYNLMGSKYNFYRICTDGLYPLKNYHGKYERFFYANYLAELKK